MRRLFPAVYLFVILVCFLMPASVLASGFPTQQRYPIGELQGWFTRSTGDFNGDGKLDLVRLMQCRPEPCQSSQISVILGRGDGRFRTPTISITTGFATGGPVVGDFNSDRKSDIAFVSGYAPSQAIAVALGNGDGTFQSAMFNLVSADWSFGLLGGDVNGDGELDLIATKTGSGVLLGNGDGTFRTLLEAPPVDGCILADTNHDGKLDAIGRSIQLGNGDGTFQAEQSILPWYFPCPVIADLNGDGNLDIASIGRAYYGEGGVVDFYFGNGDGSFQPRVSKWLLAAPWDLMTGDFNGDGKPDLIASRGSEIDVFLNLRNANFRPAVGYVSGGFFVLGDFNSDGRTDVVFLRNTTFFSTDGVAIPVITGPGGTLPLPRSYWVPYGALSIRTGDVNGDGKKDLLVLGNRQLQRLLGDGDGRFKLQPGLVSAVWNSCMETADLNSDGKLDLVLSGGANVKVRLGFGDGTFQEPIRYPFEQASCPIIADFNGDGVPDVALSSTSWYRQGIILLGNGDGTFRNGAVLPGQVDLVAGDFNNDGKQDLAVAAKGSVGIMLGNGDGTFQAISLMRKGQVGRLRSGDFNSDGKLDVVGIGTNASGAATASMYLGSGDGTLLAAKNIWVMEGAGNGVSSSITAMVAADFDRDGKLDLAISFYSNDVAILRGDGTGGFQPRSLYLGGKASLVAGDFDGNGTTDLVTSVGTVAVMLNQP